MNGQNKPRYVVNFNRKQRLGLSKLGNWSSWQTGFRPQLQNKKVPISVSNSQVT